MSKEVDNRGKIISLMNIDLRNVFILGDLFDQIKGGDLNM